MNYWRQLRSVIRFAQRQAVSGDIATVHHLPPTLMAQYYFGDRQDKLRPYMGVGVNYTTFFDEKFNQKGKDTG
ncbi:Outer membrane protein W precursor [Serratia rubidaea]|uniref:Outer membrane protein W n=1 Tax=Serratia rubidaea TaxID=61652 RepID=A0A3S4GGN2_SERRU|nr:Outer membrane protein W precursor [Serratia rubidaea]